jgi:hypothetical protein
MSLLTATATQASIWPLEEAATRDLAGPDTLR